MTIQRIWVDKEFYNKLKRDALNNGMSVTDYTKTIAKIQNQLIETIIPKNGKGKIRITI